MSDCEPIVFRPRHAGASSPAAPPGAAGGTPQISFNRQEMTAIMELYGRKVAAGDWRDYALDLMRDKAVFSVFRRASECPLYRIEKDPRLARKQGAFSVVAAGGLILKRGSDLRRVLDVLDTRLQVISR